MSTNSQSFQKISRFSRNCSKEKDSPEWLLILGQSYHLAIMNRVLNLRLFLLRLQNRFSEFGEEQVHMESLGKKTGFPVAPEDLCMSFGISQIELHIC